MRDLAVLALLISCIGFALKRAWWGVLALAIFSYLNPHAYAWGFVRSLPAFQVLFFVVVFSTLTTKDRQPIPNDWRVYLFTLLWIYFFITTTQAYLDAVAWERYWFVTKIYIPFFFTLVLINTREKLYYLIITIAASFGIVGVKGGVFAVIHGFSSRVYGPPATQFEENNAFAIAILMAVPLLVLWFKETTDKWIKRGLLIAIPLCFASALSSWSRGALLAMGVLLIVLLWHSKRRFLILPVILLGGILAAQYLPDEWFDRMSTLQTYEQDTSAMNRIEAWTDGWNHTLKHPFVGAGFEGWRSVTRRDWHNSFVEMFSEHGFIAFGIWLSLILGTLYTLTWLPRQTKTVANMEWVANYSYMIRASILVYMAGTMFLGLSYWDILYHLIFITVLLKNLALKELEEQEGQK